jgi:hypothetical protein
MHHGTIIVAELIQQLDGCDPPAEVRLAHQPSWPFAYAIDPATAAARSSWTTPHSSTSAKESSSATSPRTSAATRPLLAPPATSKE